jgi:hypothetical protein
MIHPASTAGVVAMGDHVPIDLEALISSPPPVSLAFARNWRPERLAPVSILASSSSTAFRCLASRPSARG